MKPTFTAPSSATTLTFSLVVKDGSQTSTADTVNVIVSSGSSDIAPNATVTASTQSTSSGQTAAKAVDGVADGYPTSPTNEWATVNGGAGSWLKLVWGSAQTIDEVVLYDRPNLSDQVTGGTLTFSDGSTVPVPSLNNDGTATTITFPAKTTTSLLFTVTSVSASTGSVGLARRSWSFRPVRVAAALRRPRPTRVPTRWSVQEPRSSWTGRAATTRGPTRPISGRRPRVRP